MRSCDVADYQISGPGVTRLSDGACIPSDPDNRDWREYLEWCAQGGGVDPAPVPVVDPAIAELETARHEAKVALLAALPDGAMTQEQMNVLFGPNGDPIPG